MERKFKIGDKVTCTAGYYKHAVGKAVKIGNGHQPFYFIEWESRCKKDYIWDASWSHENHLVLRGNFKGKDNLGLSEKEIEMTTPSTMEVGKCYKNNTSKRVVKVLAVSTKGDVFVEGVESDDAVWRGHGSTINPSSFHNWKEYTEPKKLYINIYEMNDMNYTGCYPTISAADEAKNKGIKNYGYKFIKRIETEI